MGVSDTKTNNELKLIDGNKRTLTDKELEDLKHYARRVYYNNPGYYYNATFEDVYHEFVLTALCGKANYSVAYQVRASFGKFSEQIPVDRPIPFSAFISTDKDGEDDLTGMDREPAFSIEDKYFDNEDSYPTIKAVADLLYSNNKELHEQFIDFIYGSAGISSRSFKYRTKLYNHAKEVLDILLDNCYLSYDDYKRYSEYLSTMTRCGSYRKPLLQSADTIRCRAYYEAHKEELRAKMRERARKRAAEKRAARKQELEQQ